MPSYRRINDQSEVFNWAQSFDQITRLIVAAFELIQEKLFDRWDGRYLEEMQSPVAFGVLRAALFRNKFLNVQETGQYPARPGLRAPQPRCLPRPTGRARRLPHLESRPHGLHPPLLCAVRRVARPRHLPRDRQDEQVSSKLRMFNVG